MACSFKPAASLLALILCAAGSLALAPAAEPPAPAIPPAKPAPVDADDLTELSVQLKDGRRFSGPVIRQNAEEVVLGISGVPMRFTIDEIEKLETLEPLMVRYRKLRDAVGDNPDQIVRLAEWLQSREKYEIALTEVDRALALDKDCATAIKLKPILREQIVLRHARIKKDVAPSETNPAAPARPAPQRPRDFPLLSEEDVRLIKVFETNLDEKPRIIIPRVVTQKLLDTYAKHPLVPITREGRDAILRQSPAEILDLMYKLQAREFYPQVDVIDQPRAFVTFRDQVCRTWLINSCSTTACHGGADSGRFILFNARPNSERTVYTNFLILSRYRLRDGTSLLNFDEPDTSPLLQFALPREKSAHPHPVVPRGVNEHDAFKPFFRSTDDVQFKAAVDWIKSLYRPRPDYPITYAPLKPFELPKPAPPAPPAPASGPAPTPPAPSSPASSTPPSAPPPPDSPKPQPR